MADSHLYQHAQRSLSCRSAARRAVLRRQANWKGALAGVERKVAAATAPETQSENVDDAKTAARAP